MDYQALTYLHKIGLVCDEYDLEKLIRCVEAANEVLREKYGTGDDRYSSYRNG